MLHDRRPWAVLIFTAVIVSVPAAGWAIGNALPVEEPEPVQLDSGATTTTAPAPEQPSATVAPSDPASEPAVPAQPAPVADAPATTTTAPTTSTTAPPTTPVASGPPSVTPWGEPIDWAQVAACLFNHHSNPNLGLWQSVGGEGYPWDAPVSEQVARTQAAYQAYGWGIFGGCAP